jgi:hypothetical protein
MRLATKLPHGSGSIQRRGRFWYLIYRDPSNALKQQSSYTEDQREAFRLLAQRVLPTLDARRAIVCQVAYGEAPTAPSHSEGNARGAGRPRRARRETECEA